MKKLYPVLFTLFLFVGGMAAGVTAQDAAPQADAPQAVDAPTLNPIGTAISYQGQLRNASGPVNGICDMTLQLFDAVTAGNAIAAPVATPVTVTNGLFVATLDFDATAFNGEARWLEISVKCAGDPGFTTLTPRQSILPTPYALALPGLRTVQNATSPNVIGGYAGNVISDTIVGSTIGGGGKEGYINLITGYYAAIGGGAANTASGNGSTIGGGDFNTTSGVASTIGGGSGNHASDHAVVGGGSQNRAGGSSTIGGGWFNDADGGGSTIGGGAYNRANNHYSTVPGGYGAVAAHYGEMAYASGAFSAPSGNAQTSVYVLRALLPGIKTSGELFLDGEDDRLTITNTRTLAFDILIVARSDAGESSGWRYEGVIENNGGTTTFIGTPTKTTLGEDDVVWDVDLIADDTNDALVIKGFSNQSGDTIRFVATVRTVEVAW